MAWCSARRLASANIFWKPASDRMFSRADNASVTSLMACVRSFSTACSFRDTGNRKPAKFSRMTSPTTNSNRSPQNNAFGAIAVQFWCILSYIRLLKQSKNVLGDGRLGGGPQPPPPLNTPLTGKELQLFRLWSWTLERRRQLNNSSISNNRNVIMSLAIIVSVN